VYRDLLITFTERDGRYTATVWRRHFPGGHQRREQVATYDLDLQAEGSEPTDMLWALIEALAFPPNFTT